MYAFWLAFVMVLVGIVLLRFGGRRSISQMTFGSVAVMLSIGAILADPLTQKSSLLTFGVIASMLATLGFIEWLEIKSNLLERLISGSAVTVIEDGALNEKNLKRLRLTVDKLEMRLRTKGIKRIEDVKTATIEVNGELGYELKPQAEPLTVGEFERLINSIIPNMVPLTDQSKNTHSNIFEEVNDGNKDKGHRNTFQ